MGLCCVWGSYGVVMKQLWGCAHRVVLVLGAGRGPLVNAALRAARMAQRRIRVYAVEKNPNAVVT